MPRSRVFMSASDGPGTALPPPVPLVMRGAGDAPAGRTTTATSRYRRRLGRLLAVVAAVTGPPALADDVGDATGRPAPAASAPAEVEAAFDAMVRDPADLEKTFQFAALAARTGDLEGAVAALERMLLLEPDLPRVKLELGVLYFRLGSHVVARRYLVEAVAGAHVPEAVRARVAEYLAALDAELAPHRLSGFTMLGARYQSNANAGPSSAEVLVGGVSATLTDDRFTGQSDLDVFAAAGFEHRYDFRRANGLRWMTEATLYGTRQRSQKQVNLALVEVSTGPERRMGRGSSADEGILVRPYARLEHVTLDDRTWYRGSGVGIGVRYRANERLELEGGADAISRRHQVHAGRPAAADRDGWVVRGRLAGRRALARGLGLRLSAGVVRHAAEAEHERHLALEAGAGLIHAFADPLGFSDRAWTASVGLDRVFSRYDAPDATIDPGTRRRQRELSAEASLTVPLGEGAAVLLSLGHRDVDASLPNYAHRNRWVSAAVAWRF